MSRIGIIIVILSTYACSPVSHRSLNKFFKATESQFQDHTGFVLYDLDKRKLLYEYNGSAYFTPASNTKILTLYASLMLLGDSVPSVRYIETPDSLVFWGLGDPSFLYKNVHYSDKVFDFLKTAGKPLYFSTANFQTAHFGAGWAWDDYTSNYSPERSPFPVYGNIFSFEAKGSDILISPAYFKQFYSLADTLPKAKVERQVWANDFRYHPQRQPLYKEWDIPFHVDQELIARLLTDTLRREVHVVNQPLRSGYRTLHSLPADSLYRVLMQDSDNFIAEQLLMMCAAIVSDTLQPEIAIKHVSENYLADAPDKLRWVDGSGLSRYNLFTPRTIAYVWQKIYDRVPRERLFKLLATGGVAGTIKNWYRADEPYIYGKTGTLSNNHCLSGFLITKSGKTFVFSFMNSNYVTSTNDIRRNMQHILRLLHNKY